MKTRIFYDQEVNRKVAHKVVSTVTDLVQDTQIPRYSRLVQDYLQLHRVRPIVLSRVVSLTGMTICLPSIEIHSMVVNGFASGVVLMTYLLC